MGINGHIQIRGDRALPNLAKDFLHMTAVLYFCLKKSQVEPTAK